MTQHLHVLIANDSPDAAALIVRELERGPLPVVYEHVQTLDALREALERMPCDVVLCDYRLKAFGAADALGLLRSVGRDLPFIVVSGTEGEDAAVAALKSGADDFLLVRRLDRLNRVVQHEIREHAERPENRRTEKSRRASDREYRSLVDHAVFGIFRVTLDGQLVTTNPALVAMLGYDSPAELVDIGMVNVFADPGAGPEFFNRGREQGLVPGIETLWRRKTGEHIRVRLTGRLTNDPRLPRQVLELVAEDVTEQHRLRQTQKMEAVGQLAGGIAHDFNNVLTAILGYSELLTDQIGPDKAIGRDLREIRVAAERAAQLTQQLLAFSRKQVIALTPIDLSALAVSLEPVLRRLLPDPIRIESVLAEDLDPVMADATQLEHLLVNLCINARDAMAGGGTLTIRTVNIVLDRSFVIGHPGSAEGAYAALSVADSGTGMPLDAQRHVFEPFFSTKERCRGAGLGLAAAYGTVKQMGGYIGVDSREGAGTIFTAYFPSAVDARVSSRVRSARGGQAGVETILLVEDESAVREFTKSALQRFGYKVFEAESAELALRVLDGLTAPVDLLLTDVVLPGMDGRELARRVLERQPATRVLFMSGYATALRTDEGFRLPGVHLLEKPFSAQTLLRMTRQLLESAPAAAQS